MDKMSETEGYETATAPVAPAPKVKQITVLDGHNMAKAENKCYNPEWVPGGDEGGVDTNTLPWVPLPHAPGSSIKPLRVSRETGHFTMLVKMPKGFVMPNHALLGASDILILSGKISYANGPLKGSVGPGVWGYTPANVRMQGMKAEEDTEYLANFYGAVAFLADDSSVKSLLTGVDVRKLADENGIRLLPNTLREALQEKPKTTMKGKAEPLAISNAAASALCARADAEVITELANPHFVDTNALPWIGAPDDKIKLKVMRVSAETGHVSLIVKHGGQAPPHYHLGPADFFIISGRIGYRAGPEEGYGPGTYMLEPAGARHEATQAVETDEELIYTANVWGPIQFDEGLDESGQVTKITSVFSWMSYLQAAQAFNSPLLENTFEDDSSLLAPSILVQ